jgi:hypothetical protein
MALAIERVATVREGPDHGKDGQQRPIDDPQVADRLSKDCDRFGRHPEPGRPRDQVECDASDESSHARGGLPREGDYAEENSLLPSARG